MSTPGSPNLLLMRQAVAAAPTGFQLPASCRFNSADTTSLKRTLPVAGDRKTWTWSAWVKRSELGNHQNLFSVFTGATDNTGYIDCNFQPTDKLQIGGWTQVYLRTTAVYRDPAAWMHVVVAVDTTNSIAADRIKFFVNGVRETAFDTENQPAQDTEWPINADGAHGIANNVYYTNTSQKLNGYLSDVQFVDGMALNPANFGEFSSTTGDFNPKEFALQAVNDGTTWSSKLSGSFDGSNNAAKAFDGDLSTYAYPAAGNTVTFTPDDPIACTTLRVYTRNDANGGGVKVNGEYQGDITTTPTWYDYTPDSHSITTISWRRESSGSIGCQVYAIEINGVLLIDDKTDNSASINDGRVWSTYMSATGGWLTTNTPDRTFNGAIPNMGNSGVSTYGNDVGGTITFAPTGGIVYKDKVELYTDQGSNYTVNGGSSQSFGPASGQSNGTWYTVATGSGTLNTLTWTPQNSGSYRPSSAAMRIDGQLLIDGVQSIYGRNGYKLLSNGFSASRAADIGKDYANGLIATANGGKPILTTTDSPNYGDTTGGSVATDSLSSSLKFAIAGNSTANITDDKSGNSNDPSISGTVVTAGNESRFYGTSMDFGNNAGRLFVNDADVTIGTNQFCMEGWFYPTNSDGNNKTALSGNWSGTQGFLLCFDRSDVANDGWCLIQGTSSSSTTITAASTHPIDTWTHVAVTRDSSNKIRLFVNGVEEASATNTNNIATTEFGIGSVYSGSQTEGWDGLVQDVRLYVGASKYEASFTPPIRNDWRPANLEVGTSNVIYSKTHSGTFEGGRGADKAFNGKVGGTDYAHAASGQTCSISWTAITGITQLRLNIAKNSGGDNWGTLELNDTDDITSWLQSNYGGTGNSGTWIDVTSQLTGTSLSKIEFSTSGNNDVRVAGIEVNGNLLVDPFYGDILTDSPTSYGTGTAGGDVRGNFATLNPLHANSVILAGYSTLTQGNLVASCGSNGNKETSGTIGVSSGKWYFELTNNSGGNNTDGVGIADLTSGTEAIYRDDGAFRYDGSESAYGASWQTVGDVIGVALDLDNTTIAFWKNGSSQGNAKTNLPAGTYHPFIYNRAGAAASELAVNFGQRAFKYSPPANYKPLCTTYLSAPTIANPAEYMAAVIYTGDGQDDRPVTLGFKPGMIWQKKRNGSDSHHVIDQVRGGSDVVYTDADSAPNAQGGDGAVNAWTATGVELNDEVGVNQDNSSFVMWGWEAGSGASGANNNGSINISSGDQWVNDAVGFSITKYTGTGSDATFGHGLSAKPEWIIIKKVNSSGNWTCQHVGATLGSGRLILDENYANDTTNADTYWNSTAPTNTLISVGDHTNTNGSGDTFICYAWTSIASYSLFSTYKGNNSSDGTFVHCGFAPKFVMVKTTNTTGNWVMYDRARLRYNPNPYVLLADDPGGGSTHDAWVGSYPIDFLSNGFKLRANTGEMNGTNDFIYMAWAESPFSTARAR